MLMTIKLSRNEIRAEVEKAIRGVGVDWGRAKDGGVMAAYLAGYGLPFIGAITQQLDELNSTVDGTRSALIDGMIITELAASSNAPWSGSVKAIGFLMAAMGIVAAEQNRGLLLSGEGGVLSFADAGGLYVRQGGFDGDAASDITLSAETIAPKTLIKCHWLASSAASISLDYWVKLGGYASRTYVEETPEKRRRGAGGGGDDG